MSNVLRKTVHRDDDGDLGIEISVLPPGVKHTVRRGVNEALTTVSVEDFEEAEDADDMKATRTAERTLLSPRRISAKSSPSDLAASPRVAKAFAEENSYSQLPDTIEEQDAEEEAEEDGQEAAEDEEEEAPDETLDDLCPDDSISQVGATSPRAGKAIPARFRKTSSAKPAPPKQFQGRSDFASTIKYRSGTEAASSSTKLPAQKNKSASVSAPKSSCKAREITKAARNSQDLKAEKDAFEDIVANANPMALNKLKWKTREITALKTRLEKAANKVACLETEAGVGLPQC